jgi:hypothetical protein
MLGSTFRRRRRYTNRQCELILGQALGQRPKNVVISNKIGVRSGVAGDSCRRFLLPPEDHLGAADLALS